MNRPAVLFDRDGTLLEDRETYVKSLDEVFPIDGAFEAVGRLCRAGFPIAICTNQSCIGRGIVGAEVVDRVHDECRRLLAEHGGTFEGIHVCPHRPEDACECRKPMPGLLLEAARDHGFDPFRSYFVGDSARDVQAARAAGVTPLLVLTGHGETARSGRLEDRTFPTVVEAVDWILTRAEGGAR